MIKEIMRHLSSNIAAAGHICRRSLLVFILCTATTTTLPSKPVLAIHCLNCICVFIAHADLQGFISAAHAGTRAFFGWSGGDPALLACSLSMPISPLGSGSCGTGEIGKHERWLVDVLFKGGADPDGRDTTGIAPAMMMMTEQMSAVMMQQMMIIGTFFDAEQQMDVQRQFERLEAEARKDYEPSVGVCMFGTTIRSLASTEERSEESWEILNRKGRQRLLGNANSNAAEGVKEDKEGRLAQFKEVYCDVDDNNKLQGNPFTGLATLCGAGGPDDRVNKDIDYTRTIEIPLTLDIDFLDEADSLSDDEEDIMAMASYLYAHDVPNRPSEYVLGPVEGQHAYLDSRSVMAKRSVAENSFYAIAALKVMGSFEVGPTYDSTDTLEYMSVLLEELGFNSSDILRIYGVCKTGIPPKCRRPSYMAQMEVLAKNIYQRPQFYVGLYDNPVNVARKGVAMRAIDLMLERDMFKSQLRSEAIISVLLELEVMKNHEDVDNQISRLKRAARIQ